MLVPAVVLLLGGCSVPQFTESRSNWHQLDARPRIEQVQTDQTAMLGRVRDAITRVTGRRNWTSPGEELSGGCTDHRFLAYSEQGKAETVGSGTWVGTAFPDTAWDPTLAAVRDTLQRSDYSRIRIVRDLPEDKDLLAYGPDDAVVHLELDGMLRLSAMSGCHLISDFDRVSGRTVEPTVPPVDS